jgi:hypothetical protein
MPFAPRADFELADPPADRGARSARPLYHAPFAIWPHRAFNAVAALLDRAGASADRTPADERPAIDDDGGGHDFAAISATKRMQ